jgi:hypothetical protein
MGSVMNITDYPIMVVVCHIAKTAGLKMPRELKSAPIAIVKRSWQVDFERLRGPLLSDTLLVKLIALYSESLRVANVNTN